MTAPSDEELERLGLYDPLAPDASDRLALIRYVLSRGATLDEVTAETANLGKLALDLNIRARGPLTLREVGDSAGLDWPTTLRLMTAAGLWTDPDLLLTADEATAVRLFAGAHNDLLGEEATLQMARVTGNAMARLAETVVGIFRLQLEVPRMDAGTPYVDVVREYAELTETLLPTFVSTLDAVLRRQIIAVAERMWSTDTERSIVTLHRTVGFVDLVGYTSTAASLSLRDLTTVLIEFDVRTSEVVAGHHGQIIKTIGDEAMFVTENADDACRIALELTGASGGTLPPSGSGWPAGRWSRCSAISTAPTSTWPPGSSPSPIPRRRWSLSRCAAGSSGFRFERLPPLTLKGFAGPTTAYRIDA